MRYSLLIIAFFYFIILGCENYLSVPNNDFTGQIDTIIDIDGNIYRTVGIGSQFWMAENLKTTRLNDGTEISLVEKDSIWIRLVNPGYCYYNNDSTVKGNLYGCLYNFSVVSSQKICPFGWHVPTEFDWNTLEIFVGGTDKAGGILKYTEGNYWNSDNYGGTDRYGFSAFPGGYRRHHSGKFLEIGNRGYWWTNKSENDSKAMIRSISNMSTHLSRFLGDKQDGYSIRCIKNEDH